MSAPYPARDISGGLQLFVSLLVLGEIAGDRLGVVD